jgi:translation elongation factor EF-G
MKDYLTLWAEGPSDEGSRNLTVPVTVIGEWKRAANSEFAKVQLTVQAAKHFEVVDSVEQQKELERLGVGWPDPVILGLLDTLMNTDLGPLKDIRVRLERVWYHEVDSTRNAFRNAGRDAGRKILDALARSLRNPT